MSDEHERQGAYRADNVVDFDAAYSKDFVAERERRRRFAEADELRRAEERRNMWGTFGAMIVFILMSLALAWVLDFFGIRTER